MPNIVQFSQVCDSINPQKLVGEIDVNHEYWITLLFNETTLGGARIIMRVTETSFRPNNEIAIQGYLISKKRTNKPKNIITFQAVWSNDLREGHMKLMEKDYNFLLSLLVAVHGVN